MKRKILSLVLITSMVCGFSACGNAGSKATTITLEGNKYDLSEEFQEVVGAMTSNGINVIYMYSGLDRMIYNEDGKLEKAEDLDKDDPNIFAMEMPVRSNSVVFREMEDELGTFVSKDFMFYGENIDFESALGITFETDKSDMKDTEIFADANAILKMKNDSYVAVFVDGEVISLADYEEDFEEWKDACDEDGAAKSFEKCFDSLHYAALGNRVLSADYLRFGHDYDDMKKSVESLGISIEDDILLAFAMEDACEKLEDGDAEKVVVIKVEIPDDEDDATIMQYTEYFFDEDWDKDKFKKED